MNDDSSFMTDNWDANRAAQHLSRKAALFDAFGRFRISTPETIFDSKLSVGKLPIFWDELVSGGAQSLHVPVDSCVRMSVSGNGDLAIRQTRQSWNYQPGKSQLGIMTFKMPTAQGVTSRAGLFHGLHAAPQNVLDGIYFEIENGVAYCCISKGSLSGGVVSTTRIPQGSWNLDRLDGTGPSARVADWSKAQILMIDYQWLGVGGVRFGFEVDSVMVYVHEFMHAGLVQAVDMQSGTQPIRYEIRSSGGAGSMDHICSSVASEAGTKRTGVTTSEDTNGTLVSCAAGSTQMLMAIRLSASQPNVQLLIESIHVLNTAANTSVRYVLLHNPTIVGTPNWQTSANSVLEVWKNSGQNITMSGGTQLASGYASKDTREANKVTDPSVGPGVGIDGTPDIIALGIESIGGTSTCSGAIGVRQLV